MNPKELINQIDRHLKDIKGIAKTLGANADNDQQDGIADLTGCLNEIEQGIMPVLRALFLER